MAKQTLTPYENLIIQELADRRYNVASLNEFTDTARIKNPRVIGEFKLVGESVGILKVEEGKDDFLVVLYSEYTGKYYTFF